jgi:hypothetical protein
VTHNVVMVGEMKRMVTSFVDEWCILMKVELVSRRPFVPPPSILPG